ncbi:aminodeoxychorismate synthase component I [Gracilibacillus thailandensis]|uniref:Aminodeoxychorismate synthase component I n=1 Tax=Gracilibacillus thailandensis TaxID=563735 RepID=A0A6N7R4R1_9BACI|nr:aminodeoxychorismate synthase component I [Gracilibacillus thailandensis]MRI68197.1 aminodeoxychorismate synthase component I [Gracilibacillus thailandensis]
METYLQFDFEGKEKTFTHPIDIITVSHVSNIHHAFNRIEKALNDGYYVAGYVSYEAAPAFDNSYIVHDNPSLPLIWFGVFKEFTTFKTKNDYVPYSISTWKNTVSHKKYNESIAKIKSLIGQGNTYQVNYTTRLKARFTGDSYSFYQQLLQNQSASYCAYLSMEDFQILSVSPELFFHVCNGQMTTKPMKGTIKRGKTLRDDAILKEQLINSKKDRAENVMIVDLLRNDLGRIAKPGTVKVERLFDIETYPTVHQMTSTISATLEKNTVFDWFQALFPCGSITGAPKVETMKYIAELEDTPREVYCGAIGFITPQREAMFNVPIRTVIIRENQATYGTGGGITWNSVPKDEYQELKQKAAVLYQKSKPFSLLESIKLEQGNYPLLSFHMNRLRESAIYFQIPHRIDYIVQQLEELATKNTNGTFKVRLLLHSNGEITLECKSVKPIPEPIQVTIARKPIDKENIFLYHKTTNRSVYKVFEEYMPMNALTTLLWNEDGFITEFTIGNVVLENNGLYYTPPVTDGLLAGTYRQKLLTDGIIKEKSVSLDEINNFDHIWFINSVRGWLKVQLIQ